MIAIVSLCSIKYIYQFVSIMIVLINYMSNWHRRSYGSLGSSV
jgi:hypothetical protein